MSIPFQLVPNSNQIILCSDHHGLITLNSEIVSDIYGCMRVALPGKSSSRPLHPNPIVSFVPRSSSQCHYCTLSHPVYIHIGLFLPGSGCSRLDFLSPSRCNWCMQSLFTHSLWYFNFLPQKISCSQKLLQIRLLRRSAFIWLRQDIDRLVCAEKLIFYYAVSNVFLVRDVLMFSNTK